MNKDSMWCKLVDCLRRMLWVLWIMFSVVMFFLWHEDRMTKEMWYIFFVMTGMPAGAWATYYCLGYIDRFRKGTIKSNGQGFLHGLKYYSGRIFYYSFNFSLALMVVLSLFWKIAEVVWYVFFFIVGVYAGSRISYYVWQHKRELYQS